MNIIYYMKNIYKVSPKYNYYSLDYHYNNISISEYVMVEDDSSYLQILNIFYKDLFYIHVELWKELDITVYFNSVPILNEEQLFGKIDLVQFKKLLLKLFFSNISLTLVK